MICVCSTHIFWFLILRNLLYFLKRVNFHDASDAYMRDEVTYLNALIKNNIVE